MKLTVGKLKEILQRAVDNLENYEDEQEISTCFNTYFVKSPFYAQVYNYGFVNLDEIEIEEQYDGGKDG